MKRQSFGGVSWKLVAGIAVLAGIGYGAYGIQTKEAAPKSDQQIVNGVTQDERKAQYQRAVEAGKTSATPWPQTERELITQFWQAMAASDYDRVLLFVPGATKKDFAMSDKFHPGPATAIGNPESNPKVPGVTLWPTTVPYPHYPNKTVKMAVMRLPDGRFAIDGGHTIWW